jgi:hypothetical protein
MPVPETGASVAWARVTGAVSGSSPLAGNSANATISSGSLAAANGVQTLTLQLEATYSLGLLAPGDSTLHLSGTIVATSSLPAVIQSIILTNGQVVLAVTNASPQSQLFSSTNLQTWSPAVATATNVSDLTIFSTPCSASCQFFRVLK